MSKMYLVLDPDHQNAPTAFHVMSHLDKQRYVGGRVTNATRKGRNENRRAEGTVDDARRKVSLESRFRWPRKGDLCK